MLLQVQIVSSYFNVLSVFLSSSHVQGLCFLRCKLIATNYLNSHLNRLGILPISYLDREQRIAGAKFMVALSN